MIKWIFFLLPAIGWGQSFAPEPGQPGSTAVHKDSSIITYWADEVFIERGLMYIADPTLGYASHGNATDAEQKANGTSVVSLGDGGIATYYFAAPISNGPGDDFAVFENGFMDHYLELAFVEVSSDNQNYIRFLATSEIQTDVQLSNFDTVNCRYVNNLAGKYRASYGTPFDLEELDGTVGLDINAITSIRIIDVVGSIDPNFGTTDQNGTIINDPFPTPFASSGFDLDGLAILQPYALGLAQEEKANFLIYPNPAKSYLEISGESFLSYKIFDFFGRILLNGKEHSIVLSDLNPGVYSIYIETESGVKIESFVKI